MATAVLPVPQAELSAHDVRRLALRAQGFLGSEGRRGGILGMLRRIGAVQLDTISVLARSHELVAYARLGPVLRDKVERAYWHPRKPATFEYWAHAACVLPIEEWPYYAFRRRAFRARGMRWHTSHERTCEEVLARLRAEGPLTATQLGGAKRGGPWWDWSETKIAVEWLLDVGEVVCVRREGWRRVYDLPERVVPDHLLRQDFSDDECLAHLAGVAARALGVVTRADLIDYHRLRDMAHKESQHAERVDEAAQAAGLIPVAIDGTRQRASDGPRQGGNGGGRRPAGNGAGKRAILGWADPDALAAAGARGRHRVTLLSPFDSLIWDRKRTLRMFGFEHALEAYVPRAKRVHGYYAMPLLAGGKLAGRVDPVRRGQTLVARQLSLESPAAIHPMATALREAADWVGCSSVAMEQVSPSHLAGPLRSALS
ncbi:MAG TPA: crosslink repair DNA glycosylase YcaQ family protein [Streptosporangiaceae bacterium]